MTWRTIAAIVVFVGVCGFIAYWGDLLGRRMGKRRLSLFGMRPRYTAIITTTITGMLIAILTAGFMMAISSEVRQLVFQGERILRERTIILRKYDAAVDASARASLEAKRQRGLAASARQEAGRAADERDRVMKERDRITRALNTLQVVLKRNEVELAKAERSLTATKHDLDAARADVASRRKEIEDQKEAIRILQAQREQLEQRVVELIGKRVIYRPSQEIARKVISCAQSKDDIRAQVIALLEEASTQAETRDARVGTNRRAVQILAKPLLQENSRRLRWSTEEESIAAVVDQISSGVGRVVVRVVSFGNSFEGEQAVVELVLNQNRLIYGAGEEVARTTIDGSKPPGEVLGALIGFLKTQVRAAAIWKGSIPTFDDEGQPSVGEVSGDQLWDTVNRIKAEGKPVVLRALTTTDIWSPDQLSLYFMIGERK